MTRRGDFVLGDMRQGRVSREICEGMAAYAGLPLSEALARARDHADVWAQWLVHAGGAEPAVAERYCSEAFDLFALALLKGRSEGRA